MVATAKSGQPGYRRIAEALARELAEQATAPDTKIGSQREFMDRFGVSAITIEGALRELERSKLIYRIRGRGTFVAARAKREIRIGIVGHAHTNWETNDYARDTFRAVQVYAQGAPCYIRFIEREADYAGLLTGGEVDGVLIIAPMVENLAPLQGLDPARHAYVLFGADWGAHASVTLDNRAMVRDAVAHLARLGHRRIALVTDPLISWDTRERSAAFRASLAARGWAIPPAWVYHGEGYAIQTPAEEASVFQQLFGGRTRPTAVVALGSRLAADMARTLESRGLRVPADVSVIGLDLPPLDNPWRDRLTLFMQPIEAMGQCAMAMLMERCQGGTRDPAKVRMRVAFRRGDSTAPPPKAAGAGRSGAVRPRAKRKSTGR